jgi:Tol biopolymer transport system component
MKSKQFLFVIVLALTSLACSQLTSLLPQRGPSGKILYVSDQNGNKQLFLISVDGGDPVQITNGTANLTSPTYIAATGQIGYISDENSRTTLYTSDTQGENTRKIIDIDGFVIDFPAWSPDGKYIAASVVEKCVAGMSECVYDIVVMKSDGSERKNLTNTPASEWVPAWSPDGQMIAFSSDRDGDSEIYLMNRDGSNVRQLTDNDGYDGTPRWSPDGTRIAFDTDRDGSDWDIYIMNADGSNPLPVTNNTTNDNGESWSPDGRWLVYLSDADSDAEICFIGVDGLNQSRLTFNQAIDFSPVWIP